MCDPSQDSKPEERFARILREETGVIIDKHLLRLFIRAHWDRIAPLAHAIHGADGKKRFDVECRKPLYRQDCI